MADDEGRRPRDVLWYENELRDLTARLVQAVNSLSNVVIEQRYLKQSIDELKEMVQNITQQLVGEHGLALRIMLLEQRLQAMELSQKIGRDWWFRLAGNLAVSTIIAVVMAFLALYIGSKGAIVK
jgi:hypothetical protein